MQMASPTSNRRRREAATFEQAALMAAILDGAVAATARVSDARHLMPRFAIEVASRFIFEFAELADASRWSDVTLMSLRPRRIGAFEAEDGLAV